MLKFLNAFLFLLFFTFLKVFIIYFQKLNYELTHKKPMSKKINKKYKVILHLLKKNNLSCIVSLKFSNKSILKII